MLPAYIESTNRLTNQYNDAIRALENSYIMERKQGLGWSLGTSQLKRQYSKRYEALAREYQGKRKEIFNSYKKANPVWSKNRKMWEWVFVVAMIGIFVCCTTTLIINEEPTASAAISQTKTTYWNAENIEIPHLKDANQYVSNPDSVLSQGAVDEMNHTLQQLDKNLGIESVVIVVNHIENDDPFRMAQDVGNKYGVGRDDRGLVVVVGYLDHSINMSPGRKLEADLTDAECHRLEQQYVVPAMRAEMPDSGMVYLTKAIYATLQQKDLPKMSKLTSESSGADDDIAAILGIFTLLMFATGGLFFWLNRKYLWVPLVGTVSLLSNPFYEASRGVYIGGGGGSFGGGSFGGGGGSFGGGSFGGGGATSRW